MLYLILVLDKNGQKMSKRLGNAVDPFDTLATYGPDATRWYMIANAQPWENLKFDLAGVDEVRRKLFGTLYNTYSFFALYANVDGFTYAEEEIPVEERAELDQWILYNKGLTLYNSEDFEGALKVFEEGLNLDSNEYDFLNGKGSTLFKLNRFTDALECYYRALELKP